MKRNKIFLFVIATLLLVLTTACGDTTHTHTYGAWTITKEPTIEVGGSASKTCECGDVVEVVIPKLSDTETWTVSNSVEATCTTTGSKTFTSEYGTVVVTIAKAEHEYGVWTFVVEPTKTEAGKATHTCKYGETEEVDVPALTDTTVWTLAEEVPATCTEVGTEKYTSVYGEIVVVVSEATGHTYGAWTITKAPTLEATGSAEKVCHCGDKETAELPVLTDTTVWTVKESINATCTVNGKTVYESVYGEVTVVSEATVHTYGAWTITKEPTLEATGNAERVCHCGDKETVEIPALAADAVWSVKEKVEPTYNEAGSTTYTSVYGEVKVTVAKLVAPYDGKTYGNFAYDADDDNNGYVNGVLNLENAWGKATLTLNELGKGEGGAFPFRGLNILSMVNPATGEIEIKQVPYASDEDGNTYLDYDSATTYSGYVDFITGIIVRTYRSSYNSILVLTPFETNTTTATSVASSWDNAIAIEYTVNETTYRIFVYKSVVYFGVSFVDGAGNNVPANECYHAPLVYVKDASGNVIEGFAFNGEKEVVVDGYEGTYTLGSETLVLSGYGKLTLNGQEGTYKVISENNLAVVVNNTYYEVELNKTEKTYTIEKPMVEITFVAGEYATVPTVVTNKNIEIKLPVPTSSTMLFGGWFYDEELTRPVEETFIPTENVTLYAKWLVKLSINLVGVLDGDASVIYLGVGEKIGTALPSYTVDPVTKKVFKGWYLDAEFTEALPEEAEVSEEDDGITIYAKWVEVPAYVGTYSGTEIWAKSSGNSSYTSLTISEDGKLSGKYTGIVVSYDKETQMITWKESATATKSYGLWFDEESGLLATHYSSKTEIGADYFLFLKDGSAKYIKLHYGIKCDKPGTTLNGYYSRLVDIETTAGVKTVFIYGDRIYSNVTISSTTGAALTTATVGDSKSLVVRDATTSEMIFAVASQGETFNKESKTNVLDKYFGTYNVQGKELVLDGTGVVVFDGKTGTYAVAATGSSYGFDVYLVDNTEYYQLTLNGSEATLVKPEVTIEFVVGDGHVAIDSVSYNINVKANLPTPSEENYVFNGWFFDAEFTKAVPASFVPTESTTLYAKFSTPADLTIVYNNGEENKVIRYSVHDIVTVDNPLYKRHKFEGWYTTAEFTEGTEWTSGTAIEEDLTIYAKWSVAPAYNNTYEPIEIYGTNANGSTSSVYERSVAIIEINPDGFAKGSGYPFRNDTKVTKYDKETGVIQLTCGTSVYNGYIDPVTGIIVMTYKSGDDAVLGEVYFLTPFTTSAKRDDFSTSYWNSGLTRCIEYTYDGTTYTVFVMNGKVYFNVSFKNAEGVAVKGADCYKTQTLYVYDSNETLIAKFGYDGTTMNQLDGYEGTYTNGTETIVLDGVKVIKLNDETGTYSVAKNTTYTLDAYINNQYFEVTLDTTNGTYTINKPMVTITFTSEHTSVDSQTLNKNIKVTLPTPTNENYKFRGWYLETTHETKVDDEYVPTADITLYAKWDAIVVLTVVYGNTLENVEERYGIGDIPEPKEPAFTNGKVFNGWYLDAEFTNAYKPVAITESLTIYCNWIDAVPQFGSYNGFETWGTGSTVYLRNDKKLNVDALGSVTGELTGKIVEYNSETGNFYIEKTGGNQYFGHFDQENKILVIAYNSKTASNPASLGTDLYVFVKADSVTGDASATVNLNAGKCRVVKITVNGESVYAYVSTDNIYYDVTFTAGGNEVEVTKLSSESDVKIMAKDGTVIASYEKGTLK